MNYCVEKEHQRQLKECYPQCDSCKAKQDKEFHQKSLKTNLEEGFDENGFIAFVKTVLLSGNNPRGKEAEENLRWGLKQYKTKKELEIKSVIKHRKEQLEDSIKKQNDERYPHQKIQLQRSIDKQKMYIQILEWTIDESDFLPL